MLCIWYVRYHVWVISLLDECLGLSKCKRLSTNCATVRCKRRLPESFGVQSSFPQSRVEQMRGLLEHHGLCWKTSLTSCWANPKKTYGPWWSYQADWNMRWATRCGTQAICINSMFVTLNMFASLSQGTCKQLLKEIPKVTRTTYIVFVFWIKQLLELERWLKGFMSLRYCNCTSRYTQ